MRIKRRTKRLLRQSLLAIPIIAVLGFLYLLLRPPSRAAATTIRVAMTAERIERGKYIFTALSDCDRCHSERDFSRLGGPVVANGRGKGAIMTLQDLSGRIVASNITPDTET